MHIDLDTYEGQTPPRTAFCIVGAGVAGLVLADHLGQSGFEVTVLEAGGFELEDRSQHLYQAEMARSEHQGSTLGRYRIFGGSSTRWGGQMLPLHEDIFDPVPGSPSLAWPIHGKDLEGYYPAVERLMHVGRLPFADTLLTELGQPKAPFSEKVRVRFSKWAPFAKRNLAAGIGQQCLANPRVHVFTHANVAELRAAGGTVSSALVLNYKEQAFEFSADLFILAAGTIESSRLLLSSPTVPDAYDQFGRGFHDHISFHAAVLPAPARKQVAQRLGPFLIDGVMHTCKIEATSETQRAHDLGAVMAHFVVEEPADSGITAARNLLTALQRKRFREAFSANLPGLLHGVSDVLRLFWYSKVLKRRAISKNAIVRLNIDMEQIAEPGNRIRLSDRRDELGLRKAVVDWCIGSRECNTAHAFAALIKSELEAAEIAPLEWTPGLLEGIKPSMADTYHAMGGLRMGTDPSTSVVDPQLKVHGMSNLYVASCAVFPSGGSSNPTFTLLALTYRLGEHLVSTMS